MPVQAQGNASPAQPSEWQKRLERGKFKLSEYWHYRYIKGLHSNALKKVNLDAKTTEYSGVRRVRFRAEKDHLTTYSNTPENTFSMITVAQERGFEKIHLTGTPDFKRQAWLYGILNGLECVGYKPSPKDFQLLEKLKAHKNELKTLGKNPDQAKWLKKMTEPLETKDEVVPKPVEFQPNKLAKLAPTDPKPKPQQPTKTTPKGQKAKTREASKMVPKIPDPTPKPTKVPAPAAPTPKLEPSPKTKPTARVPDPKPEQPAQRVEPNAATFHRFQTGEPPKQEPLPDLNPNFETLFYFRDVTQLETAKRVFYNLNDLETRALSMASEEKTQLQIALTKDVGALDAKSFRNLKALMGAHFEANVVEVLDLALKTYRESKRLETLPSQPTEVLLERLYEMAPDYVQRMGEELFLFGPANILAHSGYRHFIVPEACKPDQALLFKRFQTEPIFEIKKAFACYIDFPQALRQRYLKKYETKSQGMLLDWETEQRQVTPNSKKLKAIMEAFSEYTHKYDYLSRLDANAFLTLPEHSYDSHKSAEEVLHQQGLYTAKPKGGGISTKPIGECARYLWEHAEVATTKFFMHGYLFGFQNLVAQWNHWQRLFPVALKKELSGLMLQITKWSVKEQDLLCVGYIQPTRKNLRQLADTYLIQAKHFRNLTYDSSQDFSMLASSQADFFDNCADDLCTVLKFPQKFPQAQPWLLPNAKPKTAEQEATQTRPKGLKKKAAQTKSKAPQKAHNMEPRPIHSNNTPDYAQPIPSENPLKTKTRTQARGR